MTGSDPCQPLVELIKPGDWYREWEVDWAISGGLISYSSAVAFMEERAAQISAGRASELVWLLEHPPLYTAGTSAKPDDLIDPTRLPVYRSGRGGQFTYHGPGQRIVYVMLDLNKRRRDVRGFINLLEKWIIAALHELSVQGVVREDRVGVWVTRPDLNPIQEHKIAAIGVRLKRWVSMHGFSLNLDPDLENFSGIVPCGISQYGVTSLTALGHQYSQAEVDDHLLNVFHQLLGPTTGVTIHLPDAGEKR